ncbi:MAG TPA: MBL fold metallo-hydrolase [Rhodanobacteraceae bacterium]|nr:MBL fold metallo-hydrolase [Rhodanobacteraceae bacterium]
MIALTCHGAARQVTGSCHLLECAGRRVLIDCGLFQGSDTIESSNAADFGFDPASIDFVLLTHAHLDHCGRIPLLVKRGFRGEVIATAPTRELARLVLSDAASLQEEDARVRARRFHRTGHSVSAPLYTIDDAFHAMDFFGRRAEYGQDIDLAPDLRVRFVDAGHMLGSASVLIEAGNGASRRRILFSGDIGNPGRPLLRVAEPPPAADVVAMEATYGDRNHRSTSASVDELVGAISDRLDSGGNIVIPTFALERAQEIIFHLAEAVRAGKLPRHLRVFLDSPMAISATAIFARYPQSLGEEARVRLAAGGDPFGLPTLRFTRDASESMAINKIEGGAVILAGSGMCTGGRVRHHLKHNLWRKDAGVIFVGYAAEGTPARRIIDGAEYVRILGEDIRIRAKIWTINGFSAHAGQDDLLSWIEHTGTPRQVLLVHGEPARGMQPLAERLKQRGLRIEMPAQGERVEIK